MFHALQHIPDLPFFRLLPGNPFSLFPDFVLHLLLRRFPVIEQLIIQIIQF